MYDLLDNALTFMSRDDFLPLNFIKKDGTSKPFVSKSLDYFLLNLIKSR